MKLQIFAFGKDKFFAILPSGSYEQIQNLVAAGDLFGRENSSFFHGSFSESYRQWRVGGRDSIQIFMLPYSITEMIGGGGRVFAGFDSDRYNPRQRFWRHAFCDVFRLCR